jgi:hypothetical protein
VARFGPQSSVVHFERELDLTLVILTVAYRSSFSEVSEMVTIRPRYVRTLTRLLQSFRSRQERGRERKMKMESPDWIAGPPAGKSQSAINAASTALLGEKLSISIKPRNLGGKIYF